MLKQTQLFICIKGQHMKKQTMTIDQLRLITKIMNRQSEPMTHAVYEVIIQGGGVSQSAAKFGIDRSNLNKKVNQYLRMHDKLKAAYSK
jgi:hypothetical protein